MNKKKHPRHRPPGTPIAMFFNGGQDDLTAGECHTMKDLYWHLCDEIGRCNRDRGCTEDIVFLAADWAFYTVDHDVDFHRLSREEVKDLPERFELTRAQAILVRQALRRMAGRAKARPRARLVIQENLMDHDPQTVYLGAVWAPPGMPAAEAGELVRELVPAFQDARPGSDLEYAAFLGLFGFEEAPDDTTYVTI